MAIYIKSTILKLENSTNSAKIAHYPAITLICSLESQHDDPDHPKIYFIVPYNIAEL